MDTVYRNKVVGFAGSWGSGLGYLLFEGGAQVPCENGPTVRALNACVSARSDDPEDPENGFIRPGHVVDNNKIAGLDIVWWYDDFGLVLAAFIVYDDWLEEGAPELDFGANRIEITEDGEVILAAEVA